MAVLRKPHIQRIVWGAAVLVFAGGFIVSVKAQPSLLSEMRPGAMLLLALVICPLMTVANMLTTKEAARFCGAHLGYGAALRIAILSTAVNHLPAPGGPILRTAAFQQAGARLKHAALANIAAGLIWIGATFIFASHFAFALAASIAIGCLGFGVLCLGAAMAIARRLPGGVASMVRLAAISYGAAILYTIAIYCALSSYGVDWSFAQTAVVSTAGVIGAAASIAPSGLGVRELASAGLAALVGADPAAAFAATASVHLAMLLVMGVCALPMAMRGKKAVSAICGKTKNDSGRAPAPSHMVNN